MSLHLGTAKLEITPPQPLALAGFAHRKERTSEVMRPLYVRAWLFEMQEEHAKTYALLVQADLIWWGTAHAAAMKAAIADRWGIARECILFHASHTHGGPQTTPEFSLEIGELDPDYTLFLEQRVFEAVSEAFDGLEEVTMELGTVQCPGIGVNRRRVEEGKVFFEPNPEGANDDTVTAICYKTADRRIKGILFHFTCHPTTTSANRVDSEYCGAAMEQLDEKYGSGVSCFLQGCCGDIRPYLERDGQFYSGGNEEIMRMGKQLTEAVENILQHEMTPLALTAITGKTAQAVLPFRQEPLDSTHLEAGGTNAQVEQWRVMRAAGQLAPQTGLFLEIQLLRLADKLYLAAMNGEMVVEYGLWIRQQLDAAILPMGYSNGMVGYVPVARQIAEGGYEGATSGFVFSYPAQLEPSCEEHIKNAVLQLLQG